MPDQGVKAGGVKEQIKSILTARRQGYDANQLLLDILDRWGGTRQFASELFSVFKDPDATPYTKQNILDMIQKLVVNNTNHNITKLQDPGDLDDEELESSLSEFGERLASWMIHAQERAKQGPTVALAPWAWPDEPPE